MNNSEIHFKYTSIIIILTLLISFVVPTFTFAGPLDSAGKFTSCTASQYISSVIIDEILGLRGLLPNLSDVLGLGAVPVQDVKLNPRYQGKEYVQDIIARCAAREILTAMNNSILTVARTAGRDGGPALVKNWRNFILQGQYRGEDIWRGLLYIAANGDGDIPPLLCDHIRESDAIKSLRPTPVPNLIQSGLNRRVDSLEEYLVATRCDPVVNANFNTFMKDFSAGGGWDTFERLLQPQNNIYGAVGLALNELVKQRSIEKESDVNEALAGSGFTSTRGATNAKDNCAVVGLNGRCIVYKDIETPGSVVLGGVNSTTQQELAWVVNVDELNELIATGIQVLFNRMLKLTNPNEGDYQIPGSIPFDPNTLPTPEPVPTEEPFPTEEPIPPPEEPASLLSDVQAERAKYGTPMTPQQLSDLLNAVAWNNRDAGWGLLSKPGGSNCPFASGPIACDILFHRPSGLHYDVLIAADPGTGPATPAWQLVGPMSTSRWLAPVEP